MWAGLNIIAGKHINFLKTRIFMIIISRCPDRYMVLLAYFSHFYYNLMINVKNGVPIIAGLGIYFQTEKIKNAPT